ncbi:extensin family protein [Aurantimonas coralicida]|uniref:extensin-like domain-containing protein n=1 Tax=Aurantimonas coralicida TaxID=182270 RepID=UPI0023A77CF0|nr:extensin family protein [Aurantimonas coralicida]MDE0922737.1 extensin family protein [Aurantimonas coralicida]
MTAIPLPERRPAGRKAASPAADTPADQSDRATPTELRDRDPAITPEAAVAAAAAIADARICEDELTRRGVTFTVGDSISEGDCGVLRPVDLDRLSSGVTIAQPTQLLCRSALALDIWVASSVVPAAKTQFPGDAVTAFRHASTYVCRSRSSGSRISEHARGSAVDVADFGFASGRRLGVEKQAEGSPEQAFQRQIRVGACGPFKTVLGPGTDADHATHFHLDIAARRNGATYCK